MKNRFVDASKKTLLNLFWLYVPLIMLFLPLYVAGATEVFFNGPEFALIASVVFGQVIEKLNEKTKKDNWVFMSLMIVCFLVASSFSTLFTVLG